MAVNNIDISTNERLQLNEDSINSGIIDRKYGRSEDYIELHIYNQDNQLLTSDYNFTQYKFPEGSTEIISSELNMDPINVLRTKGYTIGQYKLVFNIQRFKLFNTSNSNIQAFTPFSVKEISPSRRELKVITPKINNFPLDREVSRFISEIESTPYLQDFILNFNDDINIVGVNMGLNKNSNKHEILIKLIDPLPLDVKITDTCRIVEEITDPIVLNVDLGLESTEDEGIPLQGPNFKIDVRLNNSVPSSFKNYDEILDYSLTSSYHNLLNHLENREVPDVSYDFIRTVSGSNEGDPLEEVYHFENFTHFSSATERLKNFEYKIQLIELYDSQTADINTITGDTATTPYVLENKEEINKKKQNLIKGFDGYERFLYYTSGTFAWPKQNSTPPYNLFSISSSESKTWLGSEIDTSPNYGGQLLSASLFDRQNENALTRLVPNHIMDNPDNSFYSSFVNMVGQHFDQIWVHIKHLTEVNDAHHTRGISKELVYFSLKSLGLETFDQFENSNLIEYILGEGASGSVYYDTPQSQSLITASVGSIPKSDITKNIWKRLYHNAPYLLKTKGTERGLRALMSCYGIPSTILNVKEYGGSTSDRTTYKTFTNDKGGLALKGDSGTNGYFIKTPWSSSLTAPLSASAKTVEFRIKPHRSDNNYHLFSLSGSTQNTRHHLILESYSGKDISSSLDSDQYGRLKYIMENGDGFDLTPTVSEYFPVYNGDFWNIFVGTEVEDPNNDPGGFFTPIKFGAYQANHLKNVNFVTSSTQNSGLTDSSTEISITTMVADAWGLEFKDSTNEKRLGADLCFIGGLPRGGSDNNVTDLRYSGSLQEVRYYFGELLSHETLKKHALEPFMYAGNTVSSSYENLVLRLPLGSNDKRDSSSFHPNPNIDYLNGQFGPELFKNGTFTGVADTGSAIGNDQFGPLHDYPTGNYNSASIENETLVIKSNPRSDIDKSNMGARFDHSATEGTSYQLSVFAREEDTGSIFIQHEGGGSIGSIFSTPNQLTVLNYTAISNNDVQIFFRANKNLIAGGTSSYDNISIKSIPQISSSMTTQTFEEVVEEHYTPTPDTVGISTTSEKTRIDTGTIDDDWLSPTRKTETSTLDNQPPDYEDLGVFFSPTNELNEDIIYTLGAFRLDDYIGSPLPNQQTASEYEDLKDIKDIYFKKVERRYNYWDYIKLIQYIDHTLFKLVEQWVPMKANLKTGLLIEPHYLERTKFARELPVIDDDQTMTPGSYNTINSEIEPNRSFNLTGSAVIYPLPPKATTKTTAAQSLSISDTFSDFHTEIPLDYNNFTISSQLESNQLVITDIEKINDQYDLYTTITDGTDNNLNDQGNITIRYTFPTPVYLSVVKLKWYYSAGAIGTVRYYDESGSELLGSTGGYIGTFSTANSIQSAPSDWNSGEWIQPEIPIEVKYFEIQGISSPEDSTRIMIEYIRAFEVNLITTNVVSQQSTNATIDIDDYILNETQEAAQAPIKPYTQTKPAGYIARKSSTLLGNVVKGRASSRYYRKLTDGKETEY